MINSKNNAPTADRFRISMLLYDTRYRSMTIQIIALVGVISALFWLGGNAFDNYFKEKPPGFGFLGDPAGYDINERLIEYTSQSTHARALLVGLLNTLLVALVGCTLATVLGVVIGVLRLSRNWIIAKIMTVYVEVFRNIPVLLWIVAFVAVYIEILPSPREFKGADATAAMLFGDTVALTNRGLSIPMPLFLDGSLFVGIGFVLAIIGSIFFGRWAKAHQEATGQILPRFWIRLAIIILPTLAIFYLLGRPITAEYPVLKGFNFQGGIYLTKAYIGLTAALALYTAAFIAEAVRAGILAIEHGQTEAAAALGVRPGRTMQLIILPQALRVIIPPLISQYLNLTKNSSLAIAVGYVELTGTIGGITLNQTGREMECLLILMACYLVISLTISTIVNYYNERIKLKER